MYGRSVFISLLFALLMVWAPSYLYASHGHDFPDPDEADVNPCDVYDCKDFSGEDHDADDEAQENEEADGEEDDGELIFEIPE